MSLSFLNLPRGKSPFEELFDLSRTLTPTFLEIGSQKKERRQMEGAQEGVIRFLRDQGLADEDIAYLLQNPDLMKERMKDFHQTALLPTERRQQEEMQLGQPSVDTLLNRLRNPFALGLPTEGSKFDESFSKWLIGDRPRPEEPIPAQTALTGDARADKLVSSPSIMDVLTGKESLPQEGKEIYSDPKAMLGILGAGALAPFEMMAALGDPLSVGLRSVTGQDLIPMPLTEAIRERGYEGLSPEARESAERLEIAVPVPPVARLAKLLPWAKGMAKAENFASKLTRFAKRSGQPIEEAAKVAEKAAEEAGVDLSKVAAGDKAESKRLFKVLEDLSPTEKRVGRVFKEKPKTDLTRHERMVKEEPLHSEEIEKYLSEREARRAEPKTPYGKMSKETRFVEGRKNLESSKEAYYKAIDRQRKFENMAHAEKNLDKKKGLEEFARRARKDVEEAKEAMESYSSMARTGDYKKATSKQMKEAAEKKLEVIQKEILEGKEIKLPKRDFNPERIAEAKKLKASPKVQVHDDHLFKAHNVYKSIYRKRLNELEDLISKVEKSPGKYSPDMLKNLNKEKDVINKLITHADADIALHGHQIRLRQMGKARRTQEKLARTKRGHPETEAAQREAEKVAEVREKRFLTDIEKEHGKQAAKEAEDIGKAWTEAVEKGETKAGEDAAKKTENLIRNKRVSARSLAGLFKNIFYNQTKVDIPTPLFSLLVRSTSKGLGLGAGGLTLYGIMNSIEKGYHRTKYGAQKTGAERAKYLRDLRQKGKSPAYIKKISRR